MTMTTLSGATPARFAFGTMQFGGKADEAASRALYDACRAAGLSHFDSAYVYTDGASETLLGRFVATEAREDLFIATKANMAGGGTRAGILDSFEGSRKRLDMEVVDLFYMHRWHAETPLEETFQTLAELQQAGKIRYIGVSNYAAWQVMKAQAVAASFGTRIDAIQPMYNLVKRQAEVEILPMCASEGIVPVPYSPLGGGLLSGKYARGEAGRLTESDQYARRYSEGSMFDTAAALENVAQELGTHSATLAVAWAARHPAQPHPILSARSVEQLRPSLEGMRYAMDDALYDRLSTLSPTPPPATDRLEER
ncbi:aldo/keto reductase [Ponticoccus alexandrii]|uniref:Aldo/keto reductase n=1 Tax=Ponticoccus alexandrii TaxID=1943633 RepID=A0ABX7FEE9_9RHOB|nr:aldo/keto reductase [Ponticoccus alexandrii]ETA50290.1 aldo/keto reductase [Rhodobacteraceae bacterium PD-2]QRF68501.1 aldo/keto reductase [Ponticoccus alexandrii]